MRAFIARALVLLLAIPTSLAAQKLEGRGMGGRMGFDIDGNAQFAFGVHADLGDIAENLRFQPVLEFGVGGGFTAINIDAELHYLFKRETPELVPYAGAGFGIGIATANNNTETDPVFVMVSGVERTLSGGDVKVGGEAKFLVASDVFFKVQLAFTYLLK